MKKVIKGDELREKTTQAVDLICGTVKNTLGPLGCDTIINSSNYTPYITNDGAIIAENIESEDITINTILSIIKSSAIKTNEKVGDGTTTTLVLLEQIYKLGLKELEKGMNGYILKKQIEKSTSKVLEMLKKEKIKINKDTLEHVATISSNDENIGKILSNLKTKYDLIEIKEGTEEIDTMEEVNGYYFDSILPSPYFLENKNEMKYDNPYILIINKKIETVYEIEEIINYILKDNSPLLIIAKEYSEEFINNVLSMNNENKTKIILCLTPEYGSNQIMILKDIEVLTKAKIVQYQNKTEVENLGTCKELIINETDIKIISEKCNESYIKSIIETSKNIKNDFNKEFMQNRINKLKNGKAIIYVGGLTEIEIREKKMRFDDALCAINTLNGGALIGGGITLLKISDKLEENNEGDKIIKQTLTKPVEILIESVGLNSKTIENKIREENYNTIYNVKSNNFENLKETKIIDSYNVVIETIKNASSIANMLLNISSIIINENNFYKTNNNFTDEI